MDVPNDYYLWNFRRLLQSVAAHSADLLAESETQFLTHVAELPAPSEMLLVRFLMRKGDFFRLDHLHYPEIGEIGAAVAPLVDKGLVTMDPPDALDARLALFTKEECLNALSRHAPEMISAYQLRSAKRDVIVERVRSQIDARSVGSWFPVTMVQVNVSQEFEVLKLLFFGNARQDLKDFVLCDLGVQRFMAYPLDEKTRLFQTREQVDAHRQFYALQDSVGESLPVAAADLLDLLDSVPEPRDRILHRRVMRFRYQIARQLERLGDVHHALALYRTLDLVTAREREARILLKTGEPEAALVCCAHMRKDPANESEALFAQSFGARVAKKIGAPWPILPRVDPPEEAIRLDPHPKGVEAAVASYLSDPDRCSYVENHLFLTVFGLIYWEVIFAPVDGAFTHPFQSRPHDLYEQDFLPLREREKQAADSLLENGNSFRATLWARMKSWEGVANPFVSWGRVDPDVLRLAMDRIPDAHWQVIFFRIWRDLRAHRSGFPDLIRFPESEGYELIEVKGPGDRLQPNQKRWMAFFADHGIPHRVVHVAWTS